MSDYRSDDYAAEQRWFPQGIGLPAWEILTIGGLLLAVAAIVTVITR